MKRHLLLFAIVTTVISVITSCKTGPSGEAYTIKMRLAPGDRFTQKMKTDMDMKMAGFNIKMVMDGEIQFDVLTGDSTGKQLKLTYNQMNIKMDMGDLNRAVNSDSMLNESQKKIIGKSVTITLSPNNEIITVSGYDSLMNNDLYDPATKQLFEKTFSKEQLNSMFGMMFSMYPSKPVKVGETWTSKSKFNIANIDMGITNKFKLLSVKDGVAELSIEGKFDGGGEIKQTGVAVDMKMKGAQNGRMQIELSDGYLKTGNHTMDLNGDVSAMGQKMTISAKGDYEMTRK